MRSSGGLSRQQANADGGIDGVVDGRPPIGITGDDEHDRVRSPRRQLLVTKPGFNRQVGDQNAAAFARPLALPPGTPKDRVLTLRKAFQDTLRDSAFLAEAEKAKLTLDPATAGELEKMVAEAFALDAALLAKLKDILYK